VNGDCRKFKVTVTGPVPVTIILFGPGKRMRYGRAAHGITTKRVHSNQHVIHSSNVHGITHSTWGRTVWACVVLSKPATNALMAANYSLATQRGNCSMSLHITHSNTPEITSDRSTLLLMASTQTNILFLGFLRDNST